MPDLTRGKTPLAGTQFILNVKKGKILAFSRSWPDVTNASRDQL